MSPRRASAPCQREVSLDRLLEVAQLEVVARMLLDRIQELVIQPCDVWKLALCPHRLDEELSLVKARQWIS